MHGRPTTQSLGDTHASHPQPLAHPRRARARPARHVHRPHHHQRRHAPTGRRPRRQLGPAAVDRRVVHHRVRRAAAHRRQHRATASGAGTHCSPAWPRSSPAPSSPPPPASTTALIAGRCVMGVGGALIMPTTLSILVNVFGDPRERAKAIAAWTAASGAGIAVGPIVGGALMRSFSWSSVFWINVPLLVAAFVGALHLVPDSRDPHATRLDPVGAVLSIAAISSLVYAIIQAPERGWTSTASLVNFAVGTRDRGPVRRLGDAPRRPDARHRPVPQPQLLRRQHRARPAVLRHGRHRVPAGAVPPVRARVHAARRRVRPRPGRRSGCCSAPEPAPTSPRCTAAGSPSPPAR